MAKSTKRKASPGDVASNRRAAHRYHLLDRLECGIALQGSEVKSLRDGRVQLMDAYASLSDGELWLHNVYIPRYAPASRENHDPERPRKLLAHRRELERLASKVNERGFTLVPTRMYFSAGRAKVEVALARGKDAYDKRQSLKAKDQQREIQRALRDVGR